MRIAHQQVAVAVDAQSAGPAVAVVRSRPGSPEKIPISIKHLNARGKVDDVDSILSINGGRARPDELAAVDAATSIDDFRLRPRPAADSNQQPEGGKAPEENRLPELEFAHELT